MGEGERGGRSFKLLRRRLLETKLHYQGNRSQSGNDVRSTSRAIRTVTHRVARIKCAHVHDRELHGSGKQR